jgi:hypothetical protein
MIGIDSRPLSASKKGILLTFFGPKIGLTSQSV